MKRAIGVLAVQGGFAAHAEALRELGHEVILVRCPKDLDRAFGLVLPGGESTAMLVLLEALGLEKPITSLVRAGRPVLATCAGLILAAVRVLSPAQASLGFIDVTVTRNAYGRQLESFEGLADDGSLPLVFIRGPRIVGVGPDVEVLATLGGEAVLVRQENVTAAAFHPELTKDRRVHREVFGDARGEVRRASSNRALVA